jgi:hypothetical protein
LKSKKNEKKNPFPLSPFKNKRKKKKSENKTHALLPPSRVRESNKKLTNNTKVAKNEKMKPTHPLPPLPSNKNGLSPPETQLHLEKEFFFSHPLPPFFQ